MEILELSIKQRYLDAILEGRKVQEQREVRPSNVARLMVLDADGYEVEDAEGLPAPRVYDAIRFRVRDTGETALVEVRDTATRVMVDDKGVPLMYEHGRGKDGQPLLWLYETVVYTLGKVLEHDTRGAHDTGEQSQ